jgi:hypothetical protein
MKIRIKIIAFCMLVNLIALFVASCRSPKEPKKISAIIINDTAAVVINLANTDVVVETKIIMRHRPLKLIIKKLASPTAPVIVGIYKSKHKFLHYCPRKVIKEGRVPPIRK